jgi:puromycin-sensitive aminopeptidase
LFSCRDYHSHPSVHRRFAKFLEDAADMQALPSDMRSPVFKIILKNGGDAAFADVKGYYDTATDNAEKKHVLNSIGSTTSLKNKLAVIEWTTSGAIKLQDFFYAIGSVHRSSKEGMELTWNYYKDNFERLKEMLGKASASLMDAVIVYSCGGFCSNQKADEIEKFFEENPMPQNQRKVLQTVEAMRANAVFLGLLENSELGDASFWKSL